MRLILYGLLIFYILPIALAVVWRLLRGRVFPQVGDRAPGGLLPPPDDPTARVRILFARGRPVRFVLGGHAFIQFKRKGATGYVRYDYDRRGEPLRNEGWIPNSPAFGPPPTFVWGVEGRRAEQLIPLIEAAVQDYGRRHVHDYRRIGPNSNTFIQGVIDGTPGLDAMLPPNALGKDYPHDGRWLRRTQTGIHLTLLGYFGVRIGWIEGFELSLMAATAGIDWRRPAIKLPALGRIGMPLTPIPAFVPGSGRLPTADMQPGMEEQAAAFAAHRRFKPMPKARRGGGRFNNG